MRAVLFILLGLVIGAVGTVNIMGAINARNPMPKAVMKTLGYHMGQLGDAVKANQCDPVKAQHHLARLQSTASDVIPVFPGMTEKQFLDDAKRLQTSLDEAVLAAPTTCETLAAAIKPVGGTCKSCHDQYR